MSLRVYLRGPDNRRYGELDDFRSLTVTRKWVGAGNWSMQLDPRSRLASTFGPGTGIIVLRDGDYYFSGPLTSRRRQSGADNKDTLTLSGMDDTGWIARRLGLPCQPNYSTAPLTYGLKETDSQAGPGETVVKHYVAYALGANAITGRSLGSFAVASDRQRGLQITQQTRFDGLADVLASACLAAGDLGYSIEQYANEYDNTTMMFDVHEVRDLTSMVKFSRGLGNLGEYDFSQSAPAANYVIVAGQGEGTERQFVEGGDVDSIATWGRIEGPLRDRRDTDDLTQLTQTLDEELDKNAQQLAISFTVVDTQRLRYGHEWSGRGDRVSVEIDGVTFSDVVREDTVTWSSDGPEKVSVVVGTPESTSPNVLRIFAAQRNVAARTARLERIP